MNLGNANFVKLLQMSDGSYDFLHSTLQWKKIMSQSKSLRGNVAHECMNRPVNVKRNMYNMEPVNGTYSSVFWLFYMIFKRILWINKIHLFV